MHKTIWIALLLLLVWDKTQAGSVPLIYEKGTYLVPVFINDKISLNFTIDSGASDVSIPADVFSTLVRTGTILRSDFVDTQEYELADGTKRTSQRFRIRSLRIGDIELRGVVASVAPPEGSLLLGQSFLSRMKNWSIDNERRLLVFNELQLRPTVQPSTTYSNSPASTSQTFTAAEKSPSMGDTEVPLTSVEIRRHCANVQFRDIGPWPYKRSSSADYYPDASKRAEEEGRVLVKFTIDTNGRTVAGSIDVNSSSGFQRLDQAAVKMVADELFFPGCSGGKPVVTSPMQAINFSLKNRAGVDEGSASAALETSQSSTSAAVRYQPSLAGRSWPISDSELWEQGENLRATAGYVAMAKFLIEAIKAGRLKTNLNRNPVESTVDSQLQFFPASVSDVVERSEQWWLVGSGPDMGKLNIAILNRTDRVIHGLKLEMSADSCKSRRTYHTYILTLSEPIHLGALMIFTTTGAMPPPVESASGWQCLIVAGVW
jgi:clan AA aspartic protease (TIGR02281 family)